MTQDKPVGDIPPGRKREANTLTKQLNSQEHRDEILDEALMETFPASDPIELASETSNS